MRSMPVEFPTDDEAAYGRYAGAPSLADLERVFFLDGEGVQYSLPVGWTDVAPVDVFVSVAAGRCALRVTDLLELALLVDGLAGGENSGV